MTSSNIIIEKFGATGSPEAQEAEAAVSLLPGLPRPMQQRIAAGMRWTLWLSLLAVPFSYGTSILLARAGPEVIGTYGLLMVYIGFVATIMYLGGDAVVIKFVPELVPERRLSFLCSYLVIITCSLIVWLVPATLWPSNLHYLFGDRAATSFLLLMLYASPLYIAFSLVVAALKSVLEMRWAHMLMRVLTIGSFVVYGILFYGFRSLLTTRCTELIWGVYLCLTALATVVGIRHLIQLEEWRSSWRTIRFFLPRGFWYYTISYEQACIISFLIARLDLILIMNFGGLAELGKYVAILTFAETIRTGTRFFSDTLLPSLTNTLASGDVGSASQLFAMNLRLLFVISLAGSSALMLLVDPIVKLFGTQYLAMRSLLILMVFLYGLAAPGSIGATLLMSIGKPQRAIWVNLGQLSVFVALFFVFWPKWHLGGVVLASGAASVFASLAFLVVARHSSVAVFSIGTDYGKFLTVMASVAVFANHTHFASLFVDLAAWAGAVTVFLLTSRYSRSECRGLVSVFLPARARLSLFRMAETPE